MNTRRWVRISPTSHIPPREGRVVTLGAREIAVFNVGGAAGEFLAVDNRCPHRGGPLADGIVAGHAVVCPLHAWKINLTTGAVERPTGRDTCVERYPVRVDNGVIVLGLPLTDGDTAEGAAA
jgi:nitrite reductase (NADH) small subunit